MLAQAYDTGCQHVLISRLKRGPVARASSAGLSLSKGTHPSRKQVTMVPNARASICRGSCGCPDMLVRAYDWEVGGEREAAP